jgi:hypothetical protein
MPNPVRAVGDFMNRPVYQPPVRAGNAGGGVRGALGRFFRGFARETVANTPGELITGGPINPARGIGQGIRAAFGGSEWAYNRAERRGDYGPVPPGEVPVVGSPRPSTGATRPSFSFGGNRPGAPLPSYFGEGRPGLPEPGHSDWEENGQPSRPLFSWEPGHPASTPQAPRPMVAPTSGAGRMGGTVIARGPAAQEMARGFAGSPMGASSYGRDRMMSQYREA